jgi:hypothetical protein
MVDVAFQLGSFKKSLLKDWLELDNLMIFLTYESNEFLDFVFFL